MAAQEPIEGTILTEGTGVGRGTRIEDAKGTVRLDTGGKESGIRGGQGGLDQSAVITIDGREANVRARAINPLEVKPLITDGEGVSSHAILRAGEILSKAAFDYSNRVSDLKADAAVVAYNQKARQAFFGSDDGVTPGFVSLKGQSAVDSRQKHFGQIDNDMSDIIASVDPEVRQKAAARLQGIRDQALNRASEHIVRAQHEAEIEMKYVKLQESERDRVNDFTRPDIDQATFLSHFGNDYKEGKIQWDVSTVKVADSIYLKERKTGGSGLEKLKTFIDINSPTVGVEARNHLDDLVKHKIAEESSLVTHQMALKKHKQDLADRTALERGYAEIDKGGEALANGVSYTYAKNVLGITDVQDFKSLASYAESKISNKAAMRDNSLEFYEKVVTPMYESGEPMNYKDYYRIALQNNVPNALAKEWYDKAQKGLDRDEKMLHENVTSIYRELNARYKTGSSMQSLMLGFGSMLRNDEEGMQKAALGVGNKEPLELSLLKNTILGISRDSTKLPLERQELINKTIEDKIAAAEKDSPIKGLGYAALVKGFTVKRTQQQALDIATGVDSVIQAKKNANAITPMMQSAASVTGMLPSQKAIDTLAEKLYADKTVRPNSLFLDVVGGKPALSCIVEDGTKNGRVKRVNKVENK